MAVAYLPFAKMEMWFGGFSQQSQTALTAVLDTQCLIKAIDSSDYDIDRFIDLTTKHMDLLEELDFVRNKLYTVNLPQ